MAAKSQCEIEFLVTGDITWASPSGRTEKRHRVEEGDRMKVGVFKDETTGDYRLVDGGWDCLIPVANFKLV